MNRRSFLRWLGIGVPAAAVATAVVPALGTTVPETVSAKLGEWNNFYSEGDPELMEAIENWKTRPADYPEPALDKNFALTWPRYWRMSELSNPNPEVEEWIRYKWNYKWTAGNSYSA